MWADLARGSEAKGIGHHRHAHARPFVQFSTPWSTTGWRENLFLASESQDFASTSGAFRVNRGFVCFLNIGKQTKMPDSSCCPAFSWAQLHTEKRKNGHRPSRSREMTSSDPAMTATNGGYRALAGNLGLICPVPRLRGKSPTEALQRMLPNPNESGRGHSPAPPALECFIHAPPHALNPSCNLARTLKKKKTSLATPSLSPTAVLGKTRIPGR